MCTGWTEEDKIHLGEELSDVLIYLVRLSDRCHVDLPAAVTRKFLLNAQKYPTSDQGSDYKNTGATDTTEEATMLHDHRGKILTKHMTAAACATLNIFFYRFEQCADRGSIQLQVSSQLGRNVIDVVLISCHGAFV